MEALLCTTRSVVSLWASVYDRERLEEADPAALTLVSGDDQAEGALVGAEILAVGGVGYQDGFVGEVKIQFGEKKTAR